MALRLRPADTTFYDLFTESANHLVKGAGLLAEMLGDGNDREMIAKQMRDTEHEADETTHSIVPAIGYAMPFAISNLLLTLMSYVFALLG